MSNTSEGINALEEMVGWQAAECLHNMHGIRCIGQDRLQHVCLPWSDTAKCGVKVIKKKVTATDMEIYRFSCYECTY